MNAHEAAVGREPLPGIPETELVQAGAGSGAKSPVVETGKMQPEKGNGARLDGYVMTWLLSVASAALMGWAWVQAHPAPKFVAIDLNSLVKSETSRLVDAMKSGATKEQQASAIRRASDFGAKLDSAIARLADECGCVVVNSAAIVAQPRKRTIQDATSRVAKLLDQSDAANQSLEKDASLANNLLRK